MAQSVQTTSRTLGPVVPLVVGLAAGLVLAAVTPGRGGLIGSGALAVVFALAVFTGLAKTSSA